MNWKRRAGTQEEAGADQDKEQLCVSGGDPFRQMEIQSQGWGWPAAGARASRLSRGARQINYGGEAWGLSPRRMIGNRPSPPHHKEPLKHNSSWVAREIWESRELPSGYSGLNDYPKDLGGKCRLTSSVQSNFHFLVSAPREPCLHLFFSSCPHQRADSLLPSYMLAVGTILELNGGCEGSPESIQLLAWLSKGNGV